MQKSIDGTNDRVQTRPGPLTQDWLTHVEHWLNIGFLHREHWIEHCLNTCQKAALPKSKQLQPQKTRFRNVQH